LYVEGNPWVQKKLFYTKLKLDQRIPKGYILRKVEMIIDFESIYKKVKSKFGLHGNVSVPSPVLLKMMSLLIFYNIVTNQN